MSFGAYVSSDSSLSLFLCSLTKGFVEDTELFLASLTNLFFLLGMFDFGCFFLFFIFKCQVICSSTRGALELIVIFAISSEIENYFAFIKNFKTLIHIGLMIQFLFVICKIFLPSSSSSTNSPWLWFIGLLICDLLLNKLWLFLNDEILSSISFSSLSSSRCVPMIPNEVGSPVEHRRLDSLLIFEILAPCNGS